MELAQKKDTAKMMELIGKMQNETNASFPPDHGYLNSGRLMNDLQFLAKHLDELQLSGVKKILLLYR